MKGQKNLGWNELDWSEIVERLAKLGTSDLGRAELKKIKPLPNSQAAENSFQEIAEMATVIRHGLRPHMESLDLFASWHKRLTRNAVLKPLELKDVRHFCLESLALDEILKDFSSPYLSSLRARLMPAGEPLSAIDQIMTPGGDIRGDASEKLNNLNIEKTGLSRQVHNVLNRLVKDFQIEHLLQDRFVTTREGRWVLPIRSGMQHGFAGIIHDASQSKQTVFMEPQEIVPTNNRLREIEIEIEGEIERLLTELSHYLGTLRFQFDETFQVLVECDQRLAQGQLSVLLDATPCQFSVDAIELRDVRHPLLILNGAEVVTNSVSLSKENRILLLSGPNAGGKTVLLKAVGLAAQMARCGLPICTGLGSKIPFFESLVIAVGDSQSVDANLSTFAAHLKTLELAARNEGSRTLILIDEICGSTDPEEGSALARSFIETYTSNEVFGIITSHLGALKLGWKEKSGVINGSLEFDPQKGPTYRFIMGVPGQSLAIQTAQRVGVNPDIVKRALANLSPDLRRYQESLNEVEKMKHEVLNLQTELSAALKNTEKEKARYEKLLAEFQKDRDALLEKEVRRATQKIDEMIQQDKVKDVFRRHEDLQKIKYDLPEIIKSSSRSAGSDSTAASARIDTPEDFARSFPPGSTVHITSLGRDGIIQGRPNAKGEVPVLSSSMRLTIPWQNLKPGVQSQNPTQRVLRKSGHYTFSPADTDRVVDLRGLSIDDAISQLEVQMDAASLGSEDRVKVIHGHGTDTLKRSIRTYLSRSVYVKKWQAGAAETGGDGVTWVELK